MFLGNKEKEHKVNKQDNKSRITFYPVQIQEEVLLPSVGGISAGFTSPAIDYACDSVDLNQTLIKHPQTTFLAYADGDCLDGGKACIGNGDLIIIDRSLEPRDGDLTVCFIDGEFTMKRVKVEKDILWLLPENEDYKPIKITPDNSFCIWGVITYSVKRHR